MVIAMELSQLFHAMETLSTAGLMTDEVAANSF